MYYFWTRLDREWRRFKEPTGRLLILSRLEAFKLLAEARRHRSLGIYPLDTLFALEKVYV